MRERRNAKRALATAVTSGRAPWRFRCARIVAGEEGRRQWEPTHPELLADIAEGHYFANATK